MNLFGLEGSGFVLAIGLTLLMGGIIVFYCNVKFRSLENKVETQKNVMQSFISQTSSMLTSDTKTDNLSSSKASQQAEDYYNDKPLPKVDVSDNDDDNNSEESYGSSSEEENTSESSDDEEEVML